MTDEMRDDGKLARIDNINGYFNVVIGDIVLFQEWGVNGKAYCNKIANRINAAYSKKVHYLVDILKIAQKFIISAGYSESPIAVDLEKALASYRKEVEK